MTKPLTSKQQYWSQQLSQAEAFDGSLADYARSQGLAAQHLYQWRNVLRKREITEVATKTVFTEVTQSGFAGPSLTVHWGRAQMVFGSLPNAHWLHQLITADD